MGLLACWQGKLGRHRNGHILLIVHQLLMWFVWRERNSRCFEDKERSILDLKLFFFRTLLDWFSTLQNQSFSSFLDFLDSCNFCIDFLTPLCISCVLGCPFFDINRKILLIKIKKTQESAPRLVGVGTRPLEKYQEIFYISLTCLYRSTIDYLV